MTLSLLFQSQPDLAGRAAPDSINLQEEQPLWPLPEAPLEVQWGGAGVQPPVWLRSTRCWCHGWSGTEVEATAWAIPLHGRKCQERDVIAFSFPILYIPIQTRGNIRVKSPEATLAYFKISPLFLLQLSTIWNKNNSLTLAIFLRFDTKRGNRGILNSPKIRNLQYKFSVI